MLVPYLKSVLPSLHFFPVIDQGFTLGPFFPNVTHLVVREGNTVSLVQVESSKPITGTVLSSPRFGSALDIMAGFWPKLY